MVKPQRSTVLAILAGTFLVLVVIALVATTATAVIMPSCGTCHKTAELTAGTKAASHNQVECAACHADGSVAGRATMGFSEVLHVAGKGAVAGSGGDVPDQRCLRCHESVRAGVSSSNGLRIDHKSCAGSNSCTDCHSNTAHGAATQWAQTYNMDKCLHCHGRKEASGECDVCHDERDEAERLTKGPWAVTHGRQWRTTHGMGDQATCGACHAQGYCDKCHGPGLPHSEDFVNEHSTLAAQPASKCMNCHKQAFCTDCHGIAMPHPSGFKAKHGSLVNKQGEDLCKTCHSDDDCTRCHLMHVHPGGAVGLSADSGAR